MKTKHLVIFIAVLLMVISCSNNRTTTPPSAILNLNISTLEVGPAGGIIFYDKGYVSDGWRYLEAAPSDSEFTAQWGSWGHEVAETQLSVGSGRRNTELIVERLTQLEETDKAAQISHDLSINGFNDWFLPSRDELNLMFQNRYIVGGFSSGWYMSSSHGTATDAWVQNFTNGMQGINSKNFIYRVRAIRAF